MSGIIKLLPDHIANQIAAGEVIQRPASVVKELLENAIDCGADKIEIIIKDAGKTLIQVLDNGSGMSEMDARMAFSRHATSKLASAEDLFALKTKGFRGEALASIAAIAHVSLSTREVQNDWGTEIIIEGSNVIEQNPVTCKIGSSFSVKNLFYNVPARRNFLKSDAVEFSHIEDEFVRVVLAHPELSFSLIHNDQVVYHLESANHRKRIVDVFGRIYNDRIVPIDEHTDIVSISGFIGKPEFSKKSRGEQFLFVNDRYFRDPFYNHAITQAYDNLLSPKTFPSYFIFLTVDPSAIDVNVHPTKTEIKFEHDKAIYSIIKSSVKQSLGKFNIVPSLDFEQETSFDLPWEMNNKPAYEPQIQVNKSFNPFSSSNGNSDALNKHSFDKQEFKKEDWQNFYTIENEETSEEIPSKLFLDDETHQGKFLFQGNYLISTLKSSLLLIHLKRAKERILYDKLMDDFIINPIVSQQLMFPISIAVNEVFKLFWEENVKLLSRLGFSVDFEENSINIQGIPAYLEPEQVHPCLEMLQEKMKIQQIDKGEIAHEFIYSIAKSAALKNLDLTQDYANSVINDLFASKEHVYSPSGKLIIKTILFEELYKQF